MFNRLITDYISKDNIVAKFVQYHHSGSCENPCKDCPERDKRIFENGKQVKLPAHPHCHCYYTNVEKKAVGTISKKGADSPDVWLKLYGKLPDYYITKKEAIENYGWRNKRNKLNGKAPGKMIGDEIFFNDKHILPEKEGRIWYECDVDYESGGRSSQRLYYSSDGLMFYSPDHLYGNVTVYLVE